MYAPKGTPADVVDKVSAALQAAVQDPVFRDKMSELGAQAVTAERARPDSLRKHLQSEIAKWTPIIRAAGAYAD